MRVDFDIEKYLVNNYATDVKLKGDIITFFAGLFNFTVIPVVDDEGIPKFEMFMEEI